MVTTFKSSALWCDGLDQPWQDFWVDLLGVVVVDARA